MADKMKTKDSKDLSKFLDQVNELESVMQGMVSQDDGAEAEAMKKADEIIARQEQKEKENREKEDSIARTVVNRTLINKDAYKNETTDGGVPENVDQAGFMAALEDDARERHERRQRATKEANELKTKGNEYYKNGEYEKAVELYTEATTKIKDLLPLWTNRAMANNRLGRYQDALDDCEWAFRIDEKCTKAYVQQGKAYLGLEEFEKSRDSYKKILEKEPKLEKQVNNYIHEVDLAEQAKNEQEQAKKLLDEENVEAMGLTELMKKLRSEQSRSEYYLGGLQVLNSFLKTEQDRLLFKTNDGFTLHLSDGIQKIISRIGVKAKKTDLDVCIALYHLYERACRGLEISQRILFEDATFAKMTMKFLESRDEKFDLVRTAILQFLLTVARDDFGLKLILTLDEEFFTRILLKLAISESRNHAMELTSQLTKLAKFNVRLRPLVSDVIVPLFVTVDSVDVKKQRLILTSFVNMTSDVQLRRQLNDSRYLWQVSSILLTDVHDLDSVISLFAFLINLTVEKSENAAKCAEDISRNALSKVHNVELQKFVLGLLSHLLPKYENSRETVNIEFVELCIQSCSSKDIDVLKYATRCLACITKNTQFSSELSTREKISPLVDSVTAKSDDIIANSLITITNVVEYGQDSEKLARYFVEVDFIKSLLVLVRDTLNETVKKNAAILLAKLTKIDSKVLERLRELSGIEILLQNVRAESL